MIYYIFAANYQHARYCAISHNLNPASSNVIYVSSPEQLLGMRKTENTAFIFYETWPDHPKYWEMLEAVRILELTSESWMPMEMETKVAENGLFTKTFWKRTAERVISTFAQALLGAMPVVSSIAKHFDFVASLEVATYAALASLLKNIIGSQLGNTSSDPSWVDSTKEDKNVDKISTENG